MKADIAKIKGHLTTAIFETFEKMFFVFLELSPELQPAARPAYCVAAGISFKGLLNGSMTILFSREIINAMVCNLLGLREEEITKQHLEDCAKESINIAGGSFLAYLESERAIDLSIPAYYPDVKNIGPLSGQNSVTLFFESDNGSLEVRMAVQNAG